MMKVEDCHTKAHVHVHQPDGEPVINPDAEVVKLYVLTDEEVEALNDIVAGHKDWELGASEWHDALDVLYPKILYKLFHNAHGRGVFLTLPDKEVTNEA